MDCVPHRVLPELKLTLCRWVSQDFIYYPSEKCILIKIHFINTLCWVIKVSLTSLLLKYAVVMLYIWRHKTTTYWKPNAHFLKKKIKEKGYGNKDLSTLVCPYSTTLNFRTFGCQSRANDLKITTLKRTKKVMAGLPVLSVNSKPHVILWENRHVII